MASLGKAERAVFGGEGEYYLWEGNLLVSYGPLGNYVASLLKLVMVLYCLLTGTHNLLF
jgi:hypothetical protein